MNSTATNDAYAQLKRLSREFEDRCLADRDGGVSFVMSMVDHVRRFSKVEHMREKATGWMQDLRKADLAYERFLDTGRQSRGYRDSFVVSPALEITDEDRSLMHSAAAILIEEEHADKLEKRWQARQKADTELRLRLFQTFDNLRQYVCGMSYEQLLEWLSGLPDEPNIAAFAELKRIAVAAREEPDE